MHVPHHLLLSWLFAVRGLQTREHWLTAFGKSLELWSLERSAVLLPQALGSGPRGSREEAGFSPLLAPSAGSGCPLAWLSLSTLLPGPLFPGDLELPTELQLDFREDGPSTAMRMSAMRSISSSPNRLLPLLWTKPAAPPAPFHHQGRLEETGRRGQGSLQVDSGLPDVVRYSGILATETTSHVKWVSVGAAAVVSSGPSNRCVCTDQVVNQL